MASDLMIPVRSMLNIAVGLDDITAVKSLVTAALSLLDDSTPNLPASAVATIQPLPKPTVTPKVEDLPEPEVGCLHQHQRLIGNELRCQRCDALLQVTGVVGRNLNASQAEWAQKAAEGTPDGPNREGT